MNTGTTVCVGACQQGEEWAGPYLSCVGAWSSLLQLAGGGAPQRGGGVDWTMEVVRWSHGGDLATCSQSQLLLSAQGPAGSWVHARRT
jgi:hypothetical protein